MKRTGVLFVFACALLFPGLVAAQSTSRDPFVRALYRYMPVMRFDNGYIPFTDDNEHFFPLRVSAITNNAGNVLQRSDNTKIAERHSNGSGLNISWLRGDKYPNGDEVRDTDVIDELDHGSNDLDTYRADAAKFQNDKHYRDRIYGHIVRYNGGAWLQYWFFYYYDDVPGTTLGDHEGDWEMIQIFVDRDVKPQVAVYAHHTNQSRCPWDKVPKERSRPVIFVARGSHASWFHTGQHGDVRHGGDLFVDGDLEKPMKLIRIGNNTPRWLNWPGFWGASGGELGNFHSPRGPKQHGQFTDPQKFYEDAPLDNDCK